jgi:mannose-6-phosphate isomerase
VPRVRIGHGHSLADSGADLPAPTIALVTTTRPLLLSPSLAERPWGGTRFGPGIGEAWDLSVHPNGPSTVASGPHAGRTLAEVVGRRPGDFGGALDLLAKRLDCAANLSVQVHPRAHDAKTEAWVVLAAEPGAGVYLGFRGTPSREQVRAAALDGTLAELLEFVPLVAGDAVFVPAGTVHAIGGGLSLFELQQSSDVTYRLFDWGRTDRELHLDDGLACAELGPPPALPTAFAGPAGRSRLVACDHFVIDRVATGSPVPLDPGGRWIAALVTRGSVTVGEIDAPEGSTVLVPRSAGAVELVPSPDVDLIVYGPPDAV